MGVCIGHIQWRDAVKGPSKVRLDAGKAFVYHDSAGGMRQDDCGKTVCYAATLYSGVNIAGNIDKLLGLFT